MSTTIPLDSHAPPATAGRAFRIVLIEDNEADAYLIQEAIRLAGIEFVLAHLNNGDDALRYLERVSELPSLVLLDLHLPGTGGPEILEAIRGEERLDAVPVVVISGASEDWLKGVDLSRSSSLIHKSMDVEGYLSEIGEAVRAFHPARCGRRDAAAEA